MALTSLPQKLILTVLVVMGTYHVAAMRSLWITRQDSTSQQKPQFLVFPNYMYKDDNVAAEVTCYSSEEETIVQVEWILQQVTCMEDMLDHMFPMNQFWIKEDLTLQDPPADAILVKFQQSFVKNYKCGSQQSSILELGDESNSSYKVAYLSSEFQYIPDNVVPTFIKTVNRSSSAPDDKTLSSRVTKPWETGMYHFYFRIYPVLPNTSAQTQVVVGMHGKYSYLSALDWPLLPMNGVIALAYLITATTWVLIWARSHRHTFKIHVIIGIVATAGAMSHTLLFVQISTTNSSGEGVGGILWVANVLRVLQVSLSSSLLMVVSTGHGITRPQLPRSILVAIIVLCVLKFIATLGFEICQENSLEVQYKFPLVMKIFLFAQGGINVIIAGWVMVAAVSTFIHLFRRKHSTKMRAFSIFTVVCVWALLAYIIVWGMSLSWVRPCRKDWYLQWLFSSFGQIVSFITLLVLMWLWRPADVQQSYAFSPLASMDDEEELGLDDNVESDESEDLDQSEGEKVKLAPL